MIVTARHLEELHRQNGGNGQITLPYRARLSPLANDWVRSRKIAIGYSDVQGPPVAHGVVQMAAAESTKVNDQTFLWWCDGACGPAKAAIAAQAKESSLTALSIPADSKQIVPVIRHVASEVKASRAIGAVLLVQNGSMACVFANRCPSLRAVMGTCLEAVEQGVQQVAANVLIIEYPYKTLQQMRNLLSRFVRGNRVLGEHVRRQLQELATCA